MSSRFSIDYYTDVIHKAYELEGWYMPYSRVYILKKSLPTSYDIQCKLKWITVISLCLDINPEKILKRNFVYFYDMCKWIIDRYYDRALYIYNRQIGRFRESWLKSLVVGLDGDGFTEDQITRCFDKWLQRRFSSRFIWSNLTVRIMLHNEPQLALNIDFHLVGVLRGLLKSGY